MFLKGDCLLVRLTADVKFIVEYSEAERFTSYGKSRDTVLGNPRVGSRYAVFMVAAVVAAAN